MIGSSRRPLSDAGAASRGSGVSFFMLIELHDVLTEEQCERLIALFGDTVTPSLVGGTDYRTQSATRTSSGAKIENDRLPQDVREALLERVAALCELPVSNQERWEILRYNVGERFTAHFDFLPKPDAPGQRLFSVVLILRAPELGGHTTFPAQRRSFEPERGKLLLWSNVTNQGGRDLLALHASTPVVRGTKWALVTWIRERPYSTER